MVCLVRSFKDYLEAKEERGEPLPKMTGMLRFEGTLFHQATDPRDKIYSLLGLIELDMTADYAASVTVRDVLLGILEYLV
jgi:hypothetical protein